MKNSFLLILILPTLILCHPSPLLAQKAFYSRTETFSSARLSYVDLNGLVKGIQNFVRNANRTNDTILASEYLIIEAPNTNLRLTENQLDLEEVDVPPVAYSIRYNYSDRIALITDVELSLLDWSRQLTVTGYSKEQVDAITAVLVERINQFEGGFGGSLSRSIGGEFLLLSGVLSVVGQRFTKGSTSWILTIISVVSSLSVWIFPWDHWLPGTGVYSGDASPLVRHGPFIS